MHSSVKLWSNFGLQVKTFNQLSHMRPQEVQMREFEVSLDESHIYIYESYICESHIYMRAIYMRAI